jgi:hypothetical protein
MFRFIKHYYLEYCNKELDWLPSDTEERYLKHLETHRGALEMNGWIDKPHFTYKFNSHGFRSDEFSDDPSVMFLGCSHTTGIGMPVEDTWARIVAKQLNLKCFNLGIGASSNDTAFRLGHHYIPLLKPQLVIWLSTDISRVELHTLRGQIEPHGPWTEDGGYFLDNWLTNPINSEYDFLKNSLGIEYVCKLNNIKLIHVPADNIMHKLDYARDLLHHGKKSNIACANSILELI